MKSIKYVAIAYLLVGAMNMNAMFIQFSSIDQIREKIHECRVINNGPITCTNESQEKKEETQNQQMQVVTVTTALSNMTINQTRVKEEEIVNDLSKMTIDKNQQ